MGNLGYCIPCGEKSQPVPAVAVIDGDPMCAACIRTIGSVPAPEEQKFEPVPPEPKPVEMCTRGCGLPTHRGLCKGQKHAPKPPATKEPQQPMQIKTNGRLDKLVAKEIDIAAVPATAAKVVPGPAGRNGELLTRLKGLCMDRAIEVQCRDPRHVGMTDRGIQKSAKKIGMKIDSRRGLKVLYVWKTAEWKEAR